MTKIICVSGTPGTGKTTLAKKLAKEKSYTYIDVNEIIKKHKLNKEFDKKRNCFVIDTKKLNAILIKVINQSKRKKLPGLIIDSHLSHYLPKKYVNEVIITTCELKTLYNRLKKRGYKKSKISENLESEIFQICRVEAQDMNHKVRVIRTD